MLGHFIGFTGSVVEDAALAWLETLGYAVLHGSDIAAGEPFAERSGPNYRDVLLERQLRQALMRLNPDLPPDALEDAFRKLTRVDAPSPVEKNRGVHRMLGDGVTIGYRRKDGSITGAQAQVIDFEQPVSSAMIDTLRSYDARPVAWSERESVREGLAAWPTAGASAPSSARARNSSWRVTCRWSFRSISG